MSSGVKAGVMMGVNKTVDAAMGLKRQRMYNPDNGGEGKDTEDKTDPNKRVVPKSTPK